MSGIEPRNMITPSDYDSGIKAWFGAIAIGDQSKRAFVMAENRYVRYVVIGGREYYFELSPGDCRHGTENAETARD